MVNQDFDKFINEQEKHKSISPGKPDRQQEGNNPKANQRGNTEKNVGASGKEI
ncbi:hypothetical protein NC661_07545 [Aquibacillus koreensis]|uniref:Uncharacterized protein n=1 Tax=Aquibacillus koreensis TaxID=279446 RepID=A0A9X3WJV5_9BACI|nr:hypothetical protein [Aquibacillus koreensis]MCT2535767.1 hypothetical protein [Aquibacillus koreensis]MDC3420223.1 hypothetical protein [Aquibacillus koreensis]